MASDNATALVALRCLGTFEVTINAKLVAAFPTDKIRGLLAYLALESRADSGRRGSRLHRREVLAGLLWPDMTDSLALSNLRLALHRLRQSLDRAAPGASAGLLTITRQTIQLNRAALTADAIMFQDLLAECAVHSHGDMLGCGECLGRLAQATDLYRGELLAGFGLADAPAFEEWLLLHREMLHQQALMALHTLIAACERRGDDHQAYLYARRQLALDPWQEETHRQLMRILARLGLYGEALVQYETCRDMLRQELGVEPDGATVALYEQVRADETLRQGDKEISRQGDLASRSQSAHPLTSVSGEAPEVAHVYGRESELSQLERWLVQDRCRLVALLGMGGVGKTTLAAAVARTVGAQFDVVIWRSLLNAPPLDELLRGVLQTLSRQQLIDVPTQLDAQLTLLLSYLRDQRCLLVLDNFESILQPDQPGQVRPGYAGYAQLIQFVTEHRHQSCLLLTSRERPQGMERWEKDTPLVYTLPLGGLDVASGQAMLTARGLSSTDVDAAGLVERYSGNPLALKLVAQTVQDLFGSDIASFLATEAPIFDDIRSVLDQQFARLSRLEQELLIWLAVEREPISIQALRDNLLAPGSPRAFLEALRGLRQRSLVEQNTHGCALQNVVTEYLTDLLIDQVYREIAGDRIARRSDHQAEGSPGALSSDFGWSSTALNRYALIKATAKEYVRASQVRLILQPLAQQLVATLGSARLVEKLKLIIASLREQAEFEPGYAAGNILNLLLHAGVDLSKYDFSHLCVWQAYLRGMYLPQLNLAGADLAGSVFTHMFGDIQELQFRADGELLVVGLSDGMAYVWRAMDSELLHAVPKFDLAYNAVRLRGDSRIAALVSADYSIVIMDIPLGRALHRLAGHQSMIWRLSFSPDGQRVASSDISSQVCVWAVESGRLLQRFQLYANPITALAFTPDGEKLAAGAVDGTVYLWDVSHGELIRTFQGHTEEVAVLLFEQDGAILATGSHDHTVRLWDVASGATIHVLRGHTQPVRVMASDSAGRVLATGGGDTFIVLWDVGSGELLRPLADHRSPILQLALSPDGQLVAASDLNETISVWDVPSGQRKDFYPMHRSAIHAVIFSLDGQRILSGGADWAVYVWDVSVPAHAYVSARLPGHRHRIKTIAISADGITLASGDFSGGLLVWDIGSHTHRALLGQQGAIMALAFSPDGRTLASAGADGTIRLWDVRAGQPSLLLCGHTNVVGTCAFSPDGRWLASGSMDRTICLWDAATGRLLSTMAGHTNIVHVVIFSPDGRRLISTSYDQTVCLWDAHTSQLLASWPAQHTVYVALAIHPDGDVLAAGGADHIVRLLETATGRELSELHGHGNTIESLSFHPTGGLLASASQDETIKLWDITSKGAPLEADASLATLRSPGPYAGMNIAGVTGISAAQKVALKALGAVDD